MEYGTHLKVGLKQVMVTPHISEEADRLDNSLNLPWGRPYLVLSDISPLKLDSLI
jgi:hypothetical protein